MVNGVVNTTLYEQYANFDKEPTFNKQGTGIYQCYCKGYASLSTASTDKGDLCNTWFRNTYGGYGISESVTVLITIVNIIIRSLCIYMIKKVGYHTLTAEITAIMMCIFIATFFNTAILLLLADANLEYVSFLSWIPLHGPFPDLTE